MLFFISIRFFFSDFLLFCVFLYIIVDLLNIDNPSKTLVFKNFEDLLYKYYPKFVKTFKKHPSKFDRRQFLFLLYDCVSNLKNSYSIDRLLKTVNFLQVKNRKVRTGKNPTTLLYSEIKKVKIF